MNRSTLGFMLACFGALVLSSACSSSERAFADDQPIALVPEEAGTLPPVSCSGKICSRDMKKVVDGCTEAVIEDCGPQKGCANGTCVAPCDAAAFAQGSAGCGFYTLPPDDDVWFAGSCFAAMIANTWDTPATIEARYGTDPLDLGASIYTVEMNGTEPVYTKLEGALPPGQVAIVFLSEIRPRPDPTVYRDFSACPLGTLGAYNGDPISHGTGKTKAFSIKTDVPVSAYSIFPYGGAKTFFPTATLLLPTSSWSTNYVAVNAWQMSKDPYFRPLGGPSMQIVAMEDDTEVRMKPKVDLYDGAGVTGSAAGKIATFKLNRGEVVQITQVDELSGSPIAANKPIGLFGGSKCTDIPETIAACDTLQQQIPPVAHWGSEYPLVPFRSRIQGDNPKPERVPYRLVGAVDGTVLTYDPERPLNAPETLSAGQLATVWTDKILSVKSQDKDHPFYASVVMTGALFNDDSGQGYKATDGDPDFVNLVPGDQFLDRYVFFADYTFPETSLTIVRKKDQNGFHPVELDCLGEVPNFKSLGKGGQYEYAWVDLTHSFSPASGTCGAGRHEAKSDGPFSLTVWGMGYCASYGYAGGAGNRPLTQVTMPVK
ncbi:IgGFc-binding protein [Labilithrix luteola]|nr:IgGFc-binding protein [Labilithrix luteola]